MKILLLAGGESSERQVSLASGRAVCGALQRLGHSVAAEDPAEGVSLLDDDGAWCVEPNLDVTAAGGVKDAGPRLLANLVDSPRLAEAELVFNTLHGGMGENGALQCVLGLLGKSFTGSDMTASAVAMHKAMAKRLFTAAGLRTPEWAYFAHVVSADLEAVAGRIREQFSPPVIVKPEDGGSTVGLTRVDDWSQLRPALERALAESPHLLAERYVPGREVTVTVLDGHAFPVVEIRPKDGLYDYRAKYTKGASEYLAPAPIPDRISGELRQAATRAYRAVGARGLARIDFILADDDRFFVLELNTSPGMTELSLAPMAAACEGLDFDTLVARMIDSAKRTGWRE